jgi:FKBP-type peptidyl-prolyl cis-trans isomerase
MASRFLVVMVLLCAGCKTAPEPDEDVVEQYPDELQIEDLTLGTGETAIAGLTVVVHYKGTLTSGQTFDSSLAREPLTFRLGARRVIKGWDQGLLGMKVGGKRRLIIPPRLGYGDKARGVIPPRSWLIFEVELLALQP